MASTVRPASVSSPFGSTTDLAIFSTPTTTRWVDLGRASETAARSSMARTRSGPRRPNQVCILLQLSRFTGDLPRTAMTYDPFSLICSGGRLSHHRRCMPNAEIRRAKASSSRRIHPSYTPATAPLPMQQLSPPCTSTDGPPSTASDEGGASAAAGTVASAAAVLNRPCRPRPRHPRVQH